MSRLLGNRCIGETQYQFLLFEDAEETTDPSSRFLSFNTSSRSDALGMSCEIVGGDVTERRSRDEVDRG